MKTREHLEAYIYKTKNDLKELNGISWPENRGALKKRISALNHLLKIASSKLK